jgi:hypothetical protein
MIICNYGRCTGLQCLARFQEILQFDSKIGQLRPSIRDDVLRMSKRISQILHFTKKRIRFGLRFKSKKAKHIARFTKERGLVAQLKAFSKVGFLVCRLALVEKLFGFSKPTIGNIL